MNAEPGRADTHPTGPPPEPPVAAPDHARIVRQVNDLLRSLGNKKAADRADTALDALLVERQQDKERIEGLLALREAAEAWWLDRMPRDEAERALMLVLADLYERDTDARAVLAGEEDTTP